MFVDGDVWLQVAEGGLDHFEDEVLEEVDGFFIFGGGGYFLVADVEDHFGHVALEDDVVEENEMFDGQELGVLGLEGGMRLFLGVEENFLVGFVEDDFVVSEFARDSHFLEDVLEEHDDFASGVGDDFEVVVLDDIFVVPVEEIDALIDKVEIDCCCCCLRIVLFLPGGGRSSSSHLIPELREPWLFC